MHKLREVDLVTNTMTVEAGFTLASIDRSSVDFEWWAQNASGHVTAVAIRKARIQWA